MVFQFTSKMNSWRMLPLNPINASGSTNSGSEGVTSRTIAVPSEMAATLPVPSTVVVKSPWPEDAPRRPAKTVLLLMPSSKARRLLLSIKIFSFWRGTSRISAAFWAMYTRPVPLVVMRSKPSPPTLRFRAPKRPSPPRMDFSNLIWPS